MSNSEDIMKNTEDSSKQISSTEERLEYVNGIVRLMGQLLGKCDINGAEALHILSTLLAGVVLDMGLDRKEWNSLVDLLTQILFREK